MSAEAAGRTRVEDAFLGYLRGLERDPAAMAALRRSVDGSAAALAQAHRYVVPFLPKESAPWREAPMYLVAALFAGHPAVGAGRDETLGAAFRKMALGPDGKPLESVERRFVALLAVDVADIGYPLRQAISLLKAREVPVCWERLLRDLLSWGHPDGWVQKRWARDFWGDRTPSKENNEGEHHVS